ncbi:MAG: exopolyphosphatase [Maioricimonas sp. JB049]
MTEQSTADATLTSGSHASPGPVAVIDIGTSSIRMAIAEILSDGRIRTLENLSQGVSLGKDTFARGEIEKGTIEECVRVLRAYRQKLDEYRISSPENLRGVATSAVREAVNRLAFIDRLYVATGFSVEPIDEAEVHRITYRSVQRMLRAEPELTDPPAVIVEVGGGNTEVLVIENGDVAFAQSYRLGSLRLRQSLQGLRAPQANVREILQLETHRVLGGLRQYGARHRPVELVTLGGDIRFAARELQPDWDLGTLAHLSGEDLTAFADRILGLTEDQIVRKFHLPFSEAETLGPALLAYRELVGILGVGHVLVASANLRDGIIREMAEGGIFAKDFRDQIVRSAIEIGRKYSFDELHARHVAEISRKLFRELQTEHGLDARDELLLYLAAYLYEIGGYVSNTSMHKHSMYLILNSDLFGLASNDKLLVALIARYHRRATPKPTHQGFNTLDRDRRVAVLKLAAILRIAIALDASRSQRVNNIQCQRSGTRLVILVPNMDDLSVEQLALRHARIMFEEVYGLSVLLRTTERPELRGQSSQL